MWLPAQIPLVSPRLVLKIYDQDKLSKEIVASLRFNIEDYLKILEERGRFPIFWKNIYGSPLKVSGDNTDLMNDQPEYASTWKGRILMQIIAEETENPTMKICTVDNRALNDSYKIEKLKEYQVFFEVSQGICLPGKEKYKIKLKIGDFELITDKPSDYTTGYCFWNYRNIKAIMKTPYPDVENMERVYIYLMDDDKPICFWRGMVSDFTNPNAAVAWVPLINDLAIGKVTKTHKAGMISFKLAIHDVERNGQIDPEYLPSWSNELPQKASLYKVRAFIYQCKELPASDKDGN